MENLKSQMKAERENRELLEMENENTLQLIEVVPWIPWWKKLTQLKKRQQEKENKLNQVESIRKILKLDRGNSLFFEYFQNWPGRRRTASLEACIVYKESLEKERDKKSLRLESFLDSLDKNLGFQIRQDITSLRYMTQSHSKQVLMCFHRNGGFWRTDSLPVEMEEDKIIPSKKLKSNFLFIIVTARGRSNKWVLFSKNSASYSLSILR